MAVELTIERAREICDNYDWQLGKLEESVADANRYAKQYPEKTAEQRLRGWIEEEMREAECETLEGEQNEVWAHGDD